MGQFVLGLDGGGTKTTAVVMDEHRTILGRGTSGSSNYHLVGLEGVKIACLSAMKRALIKARIDRGHIDSTTWALAGFGPGAKTEGIETLMTETLPGIPVQVVSDAVAALVGGLGIRCGVVLIAGTGMIAYGENEEGEQARAGGWGHLLDRGSAYGLVEAALRAVARAVDGRDRSTTMIKEFLRALNLRTISDLVRWVYASDRSVPDLAALAPIVLNAAVSGDLAAIELVTRGADALAEAVVSVVHRLNFVHQPFPLVYGGGLLINHEFYRELVSQAIATRISNAEWMLPIAEPAVGAAWLALEALGYPIESRQLEFAHETDLWMSEERNMLTMDLDMFSGQEIIGLMHVEDRRAWEAVTPALPDIGKLVDEITDRMGQGGRLIYIGSGTSGRLGMLDAAECPPTFGTDPGQVIGITAGGQKAKRTAAEAAEDDETAGEWAIEELEVNPKDSVVGIAASGRTLFVAGALIEARRRGALTAALICNYPARLAQLAEHVLVILVGPEVLTGSTRLKAGTAQKMVLNMISTAAMVRLGKTYGNLMVDMRPQNKKLANRTKHIVAQACGISQAEAIAALKVCEGDAKVAIVSTKLGCTPQESREWLAEAEGQVRAALAIGSESKTKP